MISAPLWSLASDHVGRRPVLLSGLLGSAFGMLAFGMSRSLLWAVGARAIIGLLNGTFTPTLAHNNDTDHLTQPITGNVAIVRTVLAELASAEGVALSKAMSVFSFCLALGWVGTLFVETGPLHHANDNSVGPLLGGFLANPRQQTRDTPSTKTFTQWPYLLPCIVSACFNIAVFMITMILLPETHGRRRREASPPERTSQDETEPLLGGDEQATADRSNTCENAELVAKPISWRGPLTLIASAV